jgi:phosphoribosyl 1,2-cyclic phosphodiesterase
METIMGFLITHNHSDHIMGLEVLTRGRDSGFHHSRGLEKYTYAQDTDHIPTVSGR